MQKGKATTMMGSKERRFAPLIQISLEELFPQDHFYRHLERTLDLSFVRKFVQQAYATGGRPDTTSGHTLPGRAGGTLSAECPAP